MLKFFYIDEYGQLEIDRIIFESYYPIIFTCKSEKNDLFICVCYQHNSDGCGWLVGKTQPYLLVKLFKDEITVRDLVDKYSTEKYKVLLQGNEYVVKHEVGGWSDKDCLPKEDSFLCVDDGEFDEEIEYYSTMNIPKYSESAFREIVRAESQINQNTALIIETFEPFANALQELKLPTELMSTLSIIEKIGVQLNNNVLLSYERFCLEKSVFKMSFDDSDSEYSVELKDGISISLGDAA